MIGEKRNLRSNSCAVSAMVGRTPWSAAGPLAGHFRAAFFERRAGPGGPARTRGSALPRYTYTLFTLALMLHRML